jgi:hypothetical protein
MGGKTRSSARARRGALLVALASTVVLVLALMPGAAQGGIVGSNQLTVQLTGNGAGRVVQSSGPGNGTPQAINCSSTGNGVSTGVCVANVPFGAPPPPWVGVTAQPPAGAEFAGWTVSPADVNIAPGYCGLAATCIVQVDEATTIRANFVQAPGSPLVVLRSGPAGGSGTVTSNPAGINCSPTVNDCTASFPNASAVVLTAAPGAGSTFGGWSGTGVPAACGSNATCTITSGQALAVTATFNIQTFALTTSVTGDGGISSNIQPGIECQTGNQGTCNASFATGSQVILTAVADSGWSFSGWNGGGCTGNATCTVTMSQAQSVTATFVVATVQASVQGNRIRMVGPRRAVRQLQVTINAEQELARIVLRVRRGGVTLQSRTVRNFEADTAVIRMNLRNGIASGRAQLQVTMVNDAGTQKVQNRNLRIPAV